MKMRSQLTSSDNDKSLLFPMNLFLTRVSRIYSRFLFDRNFIKKFITQDGNNALTSTSCLWVKIVGVVDLRVPFLRSTMKHFSTRFQCIKADVYFQILEHKDENWKKFKHLAKNYCSIVSLIKINWKLFTLWFYSVNLKNTVI